MLSKWRCACVEGHRSRWCDRVAACSVRGRAVGCNYKALRRPGRDTSPSLHVISYRYHCHRYRLLLVVNSVVRLVFQYNSKMSAMKILMCAFAIVCISIRQSMAAPAPQEESFPPMPYEYKYDVEDQEKLLFFGANEAGDAQGKVSGGYRVLLPDGRLMNVEYTVEGDSGFVPKISFEDNANPFGKGK